uniref:AtPDCT1/2 transmembrane domain-containing protein n=1 Tax=Oryza brachyantha TaxID=4533 RepID=J3MFP1_ORYBR
MDFMIRFCVLPAGELPNICRIWDECDCDADGFLAVPAWHGVRLQVFVAMQAAYILWAILAEGRPRAAVAALMMFTCRGALGCATQLPLPAEFLGSGMDFPVGNVSFFLFFSGHVAGAVIAAEDMRRAGRRGLARLYDALNLLQGVRLLACRGHYTIDLAVGVGAGPLFDMLAGRYLDGKNVVDGAAAAPGTGSRCCSCHKALLSQ